MVTPNDTLKQHAADKFKDATREELIDYCVDLMRNEEEDFQRATAFDARKYDWPFNLLAAITSESFVDTFTPPDDFGATVNYVMATVLNPTAYIVMYKIFYEGHTLDSATKDIGISRSRIGQIAHRTIHNLRTPACIKLLTKGVHATINELMETNKTLEYKIDLLEQLTNSEPKDTKPAETKAADASTDIEEQIYHRLCQPLENVGFSVRTYNCLKRSNCNTIGDVAILPIEELANIRNMGRVSIEEIQNAIVTYGLHVFTKEHLRHIYHQPRTK